MASGRGFSAQFPGDSIHAIMVNESFVKAAGWSDGVGKTVDFMNLPDWGDKKLIIVGVVKDHHFESFKERIKPEVFTYEPKLPLGKFEIRISPDNMSNTLQALETSFRKVLPYDPFQYQFVEDINHKNYEKEERWKAIMTTAAGITIFVSCFGLLGLTSLSTEQRAKEIGIRRVLGSTTLQIVKMIAKDFMVLTLIGFCIAIPVAWFAIDKWLQGFAYRVDINIRIFIAAGIASMLMALATIILQICKSSLVNPLKVLKGE
jgi:putative ABC transport system permease protein